MMRVNANASAKFFEAYRSMPRWLWMGDRFGWPVIVALVFLTISVIAIDFVWRLLVIPFGRLVAYALALDGLAAVLLAVAYLLVFRGFRNKNSK